MAANQEVPIGDDELDALMAELDSETAGMVVVPVVAATPVAAPPTVDDLTADVKVGLDEDDKANDDIAKVDTDKSEVAKAAEPIVAIAAEISDEIDAEMAALEAELADTPAVKPTAAVTFVDPAAGYQEKTKVVSEGDTLTTDKLARAKAAAGKKPAAVVQAETDLANVVEAVKPAAKPVAPEPAMPVAEPAPPAPKKALEFHIDVGTFRDETRVSETNLDDCMMQQASLLAHYAALWARSEAQAARIKLQVEIAEAKLFHEARTTLAARHAVAGEKVTEKMVENHVRMDPRFAAIHTRLIDAESIAAVNKGLVESLKQRRDMIIQLGADRREDGKGAARIMAASDAHSDLKHRARAAGQMGGA